jgi:Carbohydrate-binding family 9
LKTKKYQILKVKESSAPLKDNEIWEEQPSLIIDEYLWIKKDYQPKVEVRMCYTDKNLMVYFKSFEDEITIKYKNINDPVHKDSCVEFFVNLFPTKSEKYFNFELNAIGTIHVGFGELGNRSVISLDDIQKIEISTSVKEPVVGKYNSDYWEVFCKIPISLFEKYYDLKFECTKVKANFYKCGDETRFEHYGIWNHIESAKPNFHLPEYFGEIFF